MVEGAKLLNLPIFVTEQIPKGIGHTAEEIRQSCRPAWRLSKKLP